MNVKTLSVLLLLVMLVGGIAVNGSRAQPLPGTSVAFQQCLEGAGKTAGRCRSLVTTLAAMEEVGGDLVGDVTGGIGGDVGGDVGGIGGDVGGVGGDDFLKDLAAKALEAFLVGLAKYVVTHFVGGGLPITLDAQADSTLFDPVR